MRKEKVNIERWKKVKGKREEDRSSKQSKRRQIEKNRIVRGEIMRRGWEEKAEIFL